MWWKRLLRALGLRGAEPLPSVITLREDRDIHRPGTVVIRDSRSYRVTKLLSVSKDGAFYEAKAE